MSNHSFFAIVFLLKENMINGNCFENIVALRKYHYGEPVLSDDVLGNSGRGTV